MKVMKARELARQLGIPRRTMTKWCQDDPSLAFKDGRVWMIRLDALAGRPGIDLVTAYTLPTARWIKATALAERAGISRKTVGNWCRDRPGFAKRIGADWYLDLDQLGADEEQIAKLLSGQTSQKEDEEEVEESPQVG